MAEQPSGADLIAAERERQVNEEGWTPEHDDGHSSGELVRAACCYAASPKRMVDPPGAPRGWNGPRVPEGWPWELSAWKPESRIRNLAKAGALIAAEIDRLNRAASDA